MHTLKEEERERGEREGGREGGEREGGRERERDGTNTHFQLHSIPVIDDDDDNDDENGDDEDDDEGVFFSNFANLSHVDLSMLAKQVQTSEVQEACKDLLPRCDEESY